MAAASPTRAWPARLPPALTHDWRRPLAFVAAWVALHVAMAGCVIGLCIGSAATTASPHIGMAEPSPVLGASDSALVGLILLGISLLPIVFGAMLAATGAARVPTAYVAALAVCSLTAAAAAAVLLVVPMPPGWVNTAVRPSHLMVGLLQALGVNLVLAEAFCAFAAAWAAFESWRTNSADAEMPFGADAAASGDKDARNTSSVTPSGPPAPASSSFSGAAAAVAGAFEQLNMAGSALSSHSFGGATSPGSGAHSAAWSVPAPPMWRSAFALPPLLTPEGPTAAAPPSGFAASISRARQSVTAALQHGTAAATMWQLCAGFLLPFLLSRWLPPGWDAPVRTWCAFLAAPSVEAERACALARRTCVRMRAPQRAHARERTDASLATARARKATRRACQHAHY